MFCLAEETQTQKHVRKQQHGGGFYSNMYDRSASQQEVQRFTCMNMFSFYSENSSSMVTLERKNDLVMMGNTHYTEEEEEKQKYKKSRGQAEEEEEEVVFYLTIYINT